jgi:2-methylisocitrate lyase-like PEP mutase family enzyme
VTRTIRDYEAAGVAGCHLEDQVFPKTGIQRTGTAWIPAAAGMPIA